LFDFEALLEFSILNLLYDLLFLEYVLTRMSMLFKHEIRISKSETITKIKNQNAKIKIIDSLRLEILFLYWKIGWGIYFLGE
jgi:hypothetical protein